MQYSNNFQIPDILMCSPKYFDVEYIINPWMNNNIHALNKLKADAQWHALYNIITKHTNVEIVEPTEGLPDMVFIANAGLLLAQKCVVANFRYPERQGESPLWKDYFISKGYETFSLPQDIYFEGEGDAIYDSTRNILWGGYNKRSSPEAYPLISSYIDREVVSLQLIDDYFYHLDTCFSTLLNNYVMYAPDAFSEDSRNQIEYRVSKAHRIEVTRHEAESFTCNAVPLDDTIVCNAASTRVKDVLNTCGFQVIETNLSEYMKAGGASKCLVLTRFIN